MDRLDGKEARNRRETFANLNHRRMAMGIWMNDPENDMNLEQLKALSTKELTALYNQYTDKMVKRMESRAKLEERTMQKLREAGQWEDGTAGGNEVSSTVPQKGKKSTTKKPPIEAPIEAEQGASEMATKKSTKTATKATQTAKPAADKNEAGKRGAPLTNHTYVAISEKSKNFNPGGNKLQASSARGIIYDAIKKKEGGVTRQKLEEQFPDQNVKSALDVLTKFGFIQVA